MASSRGLVGHQVDYWEEGTGGRRSGEDDGRRRPPLLL